MSDNQQAKKEYSASSLAKELGFNPADVFQKLADLKYITKPGDTWELTPLGKIKGGQYKEGPYAKYIAWPETIVKDFEATQPHSEQMLLTATTIGKKFDIPASRINAIMSELAWIMKDIKGWQITDLGKRLGGIQSRDQSTGIPYVRWPEAILNNKLLAKSIAEAKGEVTIDEKVVVPAPGPDTGDFREKYKAEYRTQDGHKVRSKAEVIIDNWLYVSKTVHAYERKLPVEEDLMCDFYIPTEKVYIEYWGLDDDKYLDRKDKKIEIYKKYQFKLIQLTDKDVANLDDVLPRKLLEFGIVTE